MSTNEQSDQPSAVSDQPTGTPSNIIVGPFGTHASPRTITPDAAPSEQRETITLEAYIKQLEEQSQTLNTRLLEATAAWCTLLTIVSEMRSRLQHVINGAQAHRPPGMKIRNPRVLVFEDALADLADILDKKLPEHAEAAAWWATRHAEIETTREMRLELMRYDRMLHEFEERLGTPRGVDEQTPTIVRFEAMVHALLNLATAKKEGATPNAQRRTLNAEGPQL